MLDCLKAIPNDTIIQTLKIYISKDKQPHSANFQKNIVIPVFGSCMLEIK